MDQLRHLLYTPPRHMNPWDPARSRSEVTKPNGASVSDGEAISALGAPGSPRSGSENGRLYSSVQKHIAEEIKSSPQRGHPNICKLVDFFEDKEFYYRKYDLRSLCRHIDAVFSGHALLWQWNGFV